AIKISNSPKIDGRLDDPVWSQVEFDDRFTQREPVEGAEPTEKTEIAIIYDEKNLYIGARLFDSEPEKIQATNMKRDGTFGTDDYFDVVFDTFHDLRNGYSFTTNPLGMRVDFSYSEDGRSRNRDWDGIWEVKTYIDDKGWYLEMAIPWQTLRFREGDDQIWGAHFARRIGRKSEDDLWRFVPLDAGRLGQERFSEMGDIIGLNGLKMGGKYEIKPYLTGGLQKDEQTNFARKELGDVGIDFKVNITSTLTADFSVNTDFAQVEADQEQINLTRFSLFFPEKRDFFLEGAEAFKFGAGKYTLGSPQASTIQLFHSRRIGIENGNRVPILAGGRLTGKFGKYSVGLISIQTDKVKIDDSLEEIQGTNFSVLRLKRDVFSRSTIGFMFLNKQENSGDYNRSIGFDSNFNVTRSLSFNIVGAGTYMPGERNKKNNFAGSAGMDWTSDLWQYSVSYLEIEKAFNPEIGFVRRTDIKRTDAGIIYSPRPEKWASIRKFNFGARGFYQTDGNNKIINREISGSFSINFESTARFSISIDREFELLDRDFEVRPGLIIGKKGYTNTNMRTSYRFDSNKAVGGSVSINGGDFFTGSTRGGGFSANIKVLNRIIGSVSFNYNRVKLPDGEFHTNRLSSRLSYTFNPDFFIKGFFQWVDDELRLEGRDRLSSNVLLRYTYRPGSDFYLAINQEDLVGKNRSVKKNRTILAKFTYFLRK
ncbi:carbohydrate binding family 9 domain-containing protein, partial [candidate division KSB1 bacterium]|nr:carbohydrate binding family 9 domain-containing protein [candidate division KSB1 bacterium]